MRYLGLTTLLTITILSISIYTLSFTILTRKVEKKAILHAMDTHGSIDFEKKQTFLKQQANKPIANLPLLKSITYKQAKEKSLKLGLDLVGGTRMSYKINIIKLLKKLAGRNKQQPAFIKALNKTKQQNPQTTHLFITQFITNYTKLSPKPIHTLFIHSDLQNKLTKNLTTQDVIKAIEQCHKQAIKNNVKTYQNRLGSSSSVNITINERQQIITLEAPGSDRIEQKRLKNIIETPGQLAIYSVEKLNKQKQTQFIQNLTQEFQKIHPSSSLPPLSKLIITNDGIMLCKKENKATVNTYLQSEVASLLLPYGISPIISTQPQNMQDGYYYTIYFANTTNPILEGTQIKNAEMGFQQGKYVVQLTTNSTGAKKLRKYTANHIGSLIMIAFDNQAYTVPIIQSEIPNGQCQITGNMSEQDAIDMANICTSGAITPTETIEETIIGPTLSEKAQSQGILAVLLALLLILLFMISYYSVAGILSSLGLIINAIIILGVLAQLKAALTLPGIAGLIISLGTGIDGNVIINEAIIDQLRKGLTLNKAITTGYNKSYAPIIDANITTLLAATILYLLGQGTIKGFAITLIIGTISSCFTSVLVTRIIKELFIKTIGINKLSFSLFKKIQ